ncbi:hypothetical protein Tco_0373707 [Tanacetum coccineum]
MKVETIHVNFNELKEMASDHNTSGPAPQRLMTASEQNSLGPAPKCQDNLPSTAITDNQSMSELDMLFSLITPTTQVHVEEDTNNQADDVVLDAYEFINPFATPVIETKDHPLEQVRGNPLRPVQTRRQLATDLEMYMFAVTVSKTELKNIKEAMADHAWIGAM